MAWTERTSSDHWQARYRRSSESIASEGGFASLMAATNRARVVEV